MRKYGSQIIRNGFTIVELIVVMVVIGILTTISVVVYSGITKQAAAVVLKSDLEGASGEIASYKLANGDYFNVLEDLNNGQGPTKSEGTVYQYVLEDGVYCLSATSEQSADAIFHISSDTYIIEEGGCGIVPKFIVSYGGTGAEQGLTVNETSDDGYIVAGQTSSFGGGGYDALLAKYDVNGVLEWSQTWGGAAWECGYAATQTSDGGYIMTGGSQSYSSGQSNMFLAKYNGSGSLEWSRIWGETPDQDSGKSVIQTSDSGYVVTGDTYSYDAGDSDMFLAKYDSAGTLLWSKTFGGTTWDSGESVIQTVDGGFAVAGVKEDGAGWADAYVAKYDQNGVLTWSKLLGGSLYDEGLELVQTNDGGLAVVGFTDSNGFKNTRDLLLAKYTSAGVLSWSRTWGGYGSDWGVSIVETSDGGLAMTGNTDGFGAGSKDTMIVKYTSDGVFLWSKTWGGAGDDYGQDIVEASDGSLVITGKTASYGAGANDLFVAKFSSMGGISGCISLLCRSVSPVIANLSISASDVNPTISSPDAASSAVTPGYSTPSPTLTNILASLPTGIPTLSFSNREVYVAYPGINQTVCEEWTVPASNTIKGFYLSHATEAGYDFFSVSVDSVEKYRQSGNVTYSYVDISGTPGNVISACITTDGLTQSGFGGEINGVVYN